MGQFQKANEDAEDLENKAEQAEADNNTVNLEFITKKVDTLNREVEQVSLGKCVCSTSCITFKSFHKLNI